MTTRLTIRNEADSPTAQEIVISAAMTKAGAPLMVLRPGESAEYQLLTASSLSIEERDAVNGAVIPPQPTAQNELAKPLPIKARNKTKMKKPIAIKAKRNGPKKKK